MLGFLCISPIFRNIAFVSDCKYIIFLQSVKSIYYYSPACIQVIFRSRDSTCKTVNRATCPARTDGAALNSVRTQSSTNIFLAFWGSAPGFPHLPAGEVRETGSACVGEGLHFFQLQPTQASPGFPNPAAAGFQVLQLCM